MRHGSTMRALKAVLLGTAALALVNLSPANSQDRGQSPSNQGEKTGPSQPQKSQHLPARDRLDRASPRAQESQPSERDSTLQPGEGSTRAARDRDGDAKAPEAQRTQDSERRSKPSQARESKTPQDRSQESDRNEKRDRKQTGDSRPDKSQTRERGNPRDLDQAKDRDSNRDRSDRARDSNSDRRLDSDQARDSNSRDNRDRANNRQVSEQQRTRISGSIRSAKVQPVRNVNFSVSVGAVVPATVRFYPVTQAIVEVYPEYRGYQLIVVEDDIVIIEPRSRKIVTIIDDGGSGRAASRFRGNLSLSEKQRAVIRRSATQRRTTGSASTTTIEREYVIGDDVPEGVEIEAFPDSVFTEIPEIRSYRYVVREDEVYVIDPLERRVIEIIR
jgi:hypothetical protein